MAEPGDQNPDDDHAVGFFSAEALAGRTRTPEPEPEPEPEEPEFEFDAPEPEPEPEPEPDWQDRVSQAGAAMRGDQRFGRRKARGVEGSTGLYAIYALTLLAVPTGGIAAIIGLLAVLGSETPEDPVARSHAIYQKRTLITGALVTPVGVVLMMVGIGVFILVSLMVWTMIRGAVGVMKLKADQPIADPRKWLF